jgi:hypothetical protein
MKVVIKFDCDNAAFEDGLANELRYVLDRAADKVLSAMAEVENSGVPCVARKLMDSNGNSVGFLSVHAE